MRQIVALMIALGCWIGIGAAPVSANTSRPVRLDELILHARAFHFFPFARTKLRFAKSPREWAEQHGEHGIEAELEVSELSALGFQGGVAEYISGSKRHAVYDALVFSSKRGARHELTAIVAQDIKQLSAHSLVKSTLATVPGSVVLSQFAASEHGSTGNVLYSSGRCVFIIGDSMSDATSREQGARPAIDAAISAYRDTKSICT